MLTYQGSRCLRQRLILSTLAVKSLKISNIRSRDDEPGIKDYEASLVHLLDKLTNGSHIEVNETGTVLKYHPGLLHGGKFEHECSLERGIGYYLEMLICLAPFCKKPLDVTLKGITNSDLDPSVDSIKYSAIPVLTQYMGTDEGLKLTIISRGMAPGGGGEINFCCPVRHKLRPLQLASQEKVKRIRGIAYAVRVSPAFANRMVDSCKELLLKFIPDVYISTDHCKGKHSGKSPGFGVTLVAETTNKVFFSAEALSNPAGSGSEPSVPEDIGKKAASLLLEEIYRGGCIDSSNQSMAALFMALGQSDVSKTLIGPLSPYTISFLKDLRDFFQVVFKMDPYQCKEDFKLGTDKVMLTCVGVGFTNISKITS